MIPRRVEPGAPQRHRDLGPVPRLVQQAMEEQLARREDDVSGLQRERPCLVGFVVVQLCDELIQLPPHRRAVVEERRRVVAAQAGRGVDRGIAQALQVTALDEEDVIDQRADGREPAAGLHRDFECLGVGPEPRAPLVPLLLRIPSQPSQSLGAGTHTSAER